MERLGGHLLISNASLWDPNFRRTVVLIGHHDDEGAVGVVLNRPGDVTVHDAVPSLAELVESDEPVFVGGPVEPGAVVVLADFQQPERAELLALGSIGFLPPASDSLELGEIRRARVFAGHAGWGPGQLEAEVAEGSWIIEPAIPLDVFHPEPDRLWGDVLARMGPRHALLRAMPVDPSMN